MKADVVINTSIPIRIINISRRGKRVTVEMPDGSRKSLRVGDILSVEASAKFHYGH